MARPKFLDEETIFEIRKLYANEKHTQSQLAEQFGISQSTICKIVNCYIHKKSVNVVMAGNAAVKIGYKWQ